MTANSALRQYVAKLERRGVLPDADRDALLALSSICRSYLANDVILDEDVAATHCAIIGKGLVSRIKHLHKGSRQIVALHIAGDAIDLQSILFTRTDHQMQAHALSEIAWIPHADVLDLATRRPIVGKALWLDTLVDASIFREWTANVGQRNARQRIAHLLLEMAARLETIGASNGNTFDLPLTQNALAEALGLSLVHLNKSLQALRQSGAVSVRHRTITLDDPVKLIELSGFNPAYLHLDQARVKCLLSPTNPVSV